MVHSLVQGSIYLVENRDKPGQSEVGDLDDVVLTDEDVSCGQISMNVVLGLEVGHAGSDLEQTNFVRADHSMREDPSLKETWNLHNEAPSFVDGATYPG